MLLSLALDSAGKSMAARIAMIAITTSSSIKVKARGPARTWRRKRDIVDSAFISSGTSVFDLIGGPASHALNRVRCQDETTNLTAIQELTVSAVRQQCRKCTAT